MLHNLDWEYIFRPFKFLFLLLYFNYNLIKISLDLIFMIDLNV